MPERKASPDQCVKSSPHHSIHELSARWEPCLMKNGPIAGGPSFALRHESFQRSHLMMSQAGFSQVNVALDAAQYLIADHTLVAEFENCLTLLHEGFLRQPFVFGGK